MPAAPPSPASRTILWRKVQGRLAVLGMTASHIIGDLLDGDSRHYTAVRFNRLLKFPARCDADTRFKLERLLRLPAGALCDQCPVDVVLAYPVPEDLAAKPADKAPDSSDVVDGPYQTSLDALLVAHELAEPQRRQLATIKALAEL